AATAKHLTTTARLPHRWSFLHDQVGYNYRMPNLNAALGCAQLAALPALVRRKRALADRYAGAFAGLKGARGKRDEILDASNAAGVHTRPVWTLMHKLPMYAECPRMELDAVASLER